MHTVPQNKDKFTINESFYCCEALNFTQPLHSCLEQWVGLLNCTSYMTGTLVKSTLQLTRIHWNQNDLIMAFQENHQFVVFLC